MADDYDDYDDVEEVDEFDDVEEVEDLDEVEELDDSAEKGRKQLKRGRVAELGDRLSGGASRPGEESIKKSPFFMGLMITIVGLAIVCAVVGIMIVVQSEKRDYDRAKAKLDQHAYAEAAEALLSFLTRYPEGEFATEARINLHLARIQQYTTADRYTIDQVKAGIAEIDKFVEVCQDLPGFEEHNDKLIRFSRRMCRVAAVVAEAKKNEECLALSKDAETKWLRFSGKEPKKSDHEKLLAAQAKAQAAIGKATRFDDAMTRINAHLEANDTFSALEARQALIDQFTALGTDTEVVALLDRILKAEQDNTKAEKVGKAAITEDYSSSEVTGAPLTLRTQASTEQVSQQTRVFAVGVDHCYALDAETGQPLWFRTIGRNAPFTPMLIDPSREDSGLLAWHSGAEELILISQADGALVWRQSVPSRPSGPPLIDQQMIFVTTVGGQIFQISANDGRIISSLTFNQPVIGPPALTQDKKHLVIPGNQSVIYTLTLKPLECTAVSHIEHRNDSVESPMITTGSMVMLADNDVATKARLRVLDFDEKTGKLSVRGNEQITVDGQVRDTCVLRGQRLYIPSTPQRVTVFNVTDAPEAEHPLAKIDAGQLEDAVAAPIYLLPGRQNDLWMASRSLRRFDVFQDNVELNQNETAPGTHLRPIQVRSDSVYVTTNESYSSSVFFSRVNPQTMEVDWRTVIGTNVVAISPSDSPGHLLLVADFGQVFRIPLDSVSKGEFILEAVTSFELPDGLTEQVGGITLKDGRIAAYCGGDDPGIWTFEPAGQLEQRWPLRSRPEVPPVALDDGVVFAQTGRMQMTAVKSVSSVSDYRAAQGTEQQTSWKSLVAVGPRQVLGITSDNVAIRVEYRSSPTPKLFEVSKTPVDPIDLRPTLGGDLLFACTSDGRLQSYSAETLEKYHELPLGQNATASPFVSGDRVFVEVARREIKVFSRSQQLQQTGSIALNGNSLAGAPLQVADGFIACLSDGTVMRLDADGKPVGESVAIGQDAQRGPIVIGDMQLVIGLDGTLYRINDLLKQD